MAVRLLSVHTYYLHVTACPLKLYIRQRGIDQSFVSKHIQPFLLPVLSSCSYLINCRSSVSRSHAHTWLIFSQSATEHVPGLSAGTWCVGSSHFPYIRFVLFLIHESIFTHMPFSTQSIQNTNQPLTRFHHRKRTIPHLPSLPPLPIQSVCHNMHIPKDVNIVFVEYRWVYF